MGRLLGVGCPAYALQVGLEGLPECQHKMLKCLVVHSHARRSCYRNTLQTHACRHLEGNFEASLIGNILRLGPLAVHHDALIPEAPVQVLNARGLAGELLRHLPMCCRCCI